MSTGQTSSQKWYNRKGNALILSVVSACLVYIVGIRAIDTGSLQQYFIVIVALIFALNRLIVVLNPLARKKKA